MTIDIEFFGQIRQLAGLPAIRLEIDETPDLESLKSSLLLRLPQLQPALQASASPQLFVDGSRLPPGAPPTWRHGSRLVLMSPMSGG
ncbi:MAG: hypothetical protein RL095_2215 [Verrucomicrobiota bacterium]|jgi:molybdopterin converting factor small subunit